MADNKTRTVHHPNFPGITRAVPEKDVDRWKAQGWRMSEADEKKIAEADEKAREQLAADAEKPQPAKATKTS